MADEVITGEVEEPSIDPVPQTTNSVSSKAPVYDGQVKFLVDNVEKTYQLAEGMIGCFANTTEYNINTTGVILRKRDENAILYKGATLWICKINGTEYVFDNNGKCNLDEATNENPDSEPPVYGQHHLYVVASSINVSEGTTVTNITRDSSETPVEKEVTISSLTVRDQFAIAALTAIINRFNDPVECSTASAEFISNKAYEYANAMMLASAQARKQDEEEEESEGSEGTVDVPKDTLSNNTEKLLNNIYKTLEASKVAEKTINVKTFTPVLKVDNPEDDKFEVEGVGGEGGGGGGEVTPPANMVTTDTAQDITGQKTFKSEKVYFNNIPTEIVSDFNSPASYFGENSCIYNHYSVITDLDTQESTIDEETLVIKGQDKIEFRGASNSALIMSLTPNGRVTATGGFINAIHNNSDSILIGDGNVADFRDLLNELQSLLNVRIAKVLNGSVYGFNVIKSFVSSMGEGYYYVSGTLNWTINNAGTVTPRSINNVIFQIIDDPVSPIINIIGGELINSEQEAINCYRTYNENTGSIELKLTNPCLDEPGSSVDSDAIINTIIGILGQSYSFVATLGYFRIVSTNISIKGFITQ